MRSNRRAPWLLFGCLLFLANCGKEETVPTSGPVGNVEMVKGEVSAKRPDQAARNVNVDDTVFANDTIITGPESSIEIRLSHNGALWRLGASGEKAIKKGVAYRATAKGVAPLQREVEVATTAAGRGSVREAADSVDTVAKPGQPGSTTLEQGGLMAATKIPTPPDDLPAARPEQTPDLPGKKPKSRESKGGKGKSPQPEILDGEGDGEDPHPGDEAKGPRVNNELKSTPQAQQRAHIEKLVRACQKEHGGSGKISYKIRKNGVLVVSSKDSSLEKVSACVETARRSDPLPNTSKVEGSIQFP